MSIRWLDEPAQRAFTVAVEEVEAASSTEVVVAVRRAARRWPHVHFTIGVLAAWAALGFMLYSAHPFSLVAILVDPFVFGGLVGAASILAPPLVRWLTPASIRRRAVVEAARAAFYARGVHHTRGRTGVLIYCALAERRAALVADDGVVRAVEPAAWKGAEAAIDQALAHGALATAKAIAALAPLLGKALPHTVDDVNELPDALDHDLGALIVATVTEASS